MADNVRRGLVRRETAMAPTPVSTAISASGRITPSSALETSPKAAPPTSATATHARDVGALWGHLDISALQNTVVENKSLRNKTRFRKFDIGIPVYIQELAACCIVMAQATSYRKHKE